MASPKTTNRFLIKLGNGASPEVFAFPCGANARSVSLTNNTGEDTLLDCDDPLDSPAVIHRFLESQDTTMSMEGRVAKNSFAVWREWADSGEEKKVQIELDEPGNAGGGYWTVSCFLTGLELGAQGKASTTFSANIVGNGRRVWTDAA
ncbi:phage tail tube protein [uncultured Jannaschia sp.]|uniref:phage tail tube protein n=1 Tax=uncultured Jannaschia sp. TaxID=293347 RepID=UPI002621EB62|nr:phage tail tube protein [uncultured Jannaschia sp.]